MRWWSIPLVLALGWFAFTLTPFWALYDLARAVQAHDAAYVERHVNFRTLRLSIIRQAAAAAQARGADEADAEPRERQRITDAAVALAIPLAETLVTPQTVVDLLDDGWPQSVDLGLPGAEPAAPKSPGAGRPAGGEPTPPDPVLSRFGDAGFRTVVIAVPPDAPRANRFRVRLRLRGWTWRLVDIELTQALRERIAQKLSRAASRAR